MTTATTKDGFVSNLSGAVEIASLGQQIGNEAAFKRLDTFSKLLMTDKVMLLIAYTLKQLRPMFPEGEVNNGLGDMATLIENNSPDRLVLRKMTAFSRAVAASLDFESPGITIFDRLAQLAPEAHIFWAVDQAKSAIIRHTRMQDPEGAKLCTVEVLVHLAMARCLKGEDFLPVSIDIFENCILLEALV